MTDKMTIEQLAEIIQNTMASKEDLKPLATKEEVKTLATKEEVYSLRGTMQDMAEEMTVMHTDIRYIRSTVDKLVHSDIVQEAAIQDLTARIHRLEQKVGLAQ